MFEGSGRLDATATFPALAAAITAIPVRPDRGGGVPVAEEARALLFLRRQLDARLLGRVAAVDEQGLAAGDGFTSTASWLRACGNLDAGPASGLVAAARIAERLPALGDVLAQGKVGVEHLQAVAGGAPRVPHDVLAVSDLTLATLACHGRPSDLRRAAGAIQARVDDTGAETDANYVHDQRRVALSPTFGGVYHLDGLLPPEAGAALAAALESLMTRQGVEDERTAVQRRADALLELTGIALRAAELPDCGGNRPRLTFLVRTDTAGNPADAAADSHLAGSQVGVAAHSGADTDQFLIGDQATLSWQTIARIGCDADLNLATVNESGEILNYGRTRRYPTPAQRRALTLRDQGCAFPGCDRRPSACQAHHLRYWSHNGKTDLDNLALICSFHHHLLHEGGWRLERIPARTGSTDHSQAPRWHATAPNGAQHRQHRQPAA